jgi:U3 small nucleolar RNA-associated protein 6
VTAEDVNPSLKQDDGVDEVALQNLASAPVLTGAIPLAVFDSAMKQFQGKAKLADSFFDMFAEFSQLACIPRILQHVLDYLQDNSPQAVETAICRFRMMLFGCDPTDPEIALALSRALDLISSAIQQHPTEIVRVSEVAVRRLLSLHRLLADSDSSLQKASRAALRKYVRAMEDGEGDKVARLAESLRQQGKRDDSELLVQTGVKYWPANEALQNLSSAMET